MIAYGLNLTTQEDLAAAGIDSIVNSGFCDGGGSGPADGPVTFEDDVFPDIELYGRIAGTEEAATEKVAELRARVAAVADQPPNPAVTTAAAIGLDGTNLRAYGVASLTHEQIETLGLTDVFSDIKERLVDVSLEEFIARDPDVVIVLSGGGGVEEMPVETLRGLPGASGRDRDPREPDHPAREPVPAGRLTRGRRPGGDGQGDRRLPVTAPGPCTIVATAV